MIDVKQAVQTALGFMGDIYDAAHLKKLAVEEFERSEDGSHWLVTVGMGGAERASTMSVVEGMGTPREYKILRIDAESGEVVSMKARPS